MSLDTTSFDLKDVSSSRDLKFLTEKSRRLGFQVYHNMIMGRSYKALEKRLAKYIEAYKQSVNGSNGHGRD